MKNLKFLLMAALLVLSFSCKKDTSKFLTNTPSWKIYQVYTSADYNADVFGFELPQLYSAADIGSVSFKDGTATFLINLNGQAYAHEYYYTTSSDNMTVNINGNNFNIEKFRKGFHLVSFDEQLKIFCEK